MSSPLSLSFGILSRMLVAEPSELGEICTPKPVLQVLTDIRCSSEDEDEPAANNCRVIASDGLNYVQVVVYKDLKPFTLLKTGQICKNDIIRADNLTIRSVERKQRRTFVLDRFERLVHGSELGMIGNPQPITKQSFVLHHHAEPAVGPSADSDFELASQQSFTTDWDTSYPDIADTYRSQPSSAAPHLLSPRSASSAATLKQPVFNEWPAEEPITQQAAPLTLSSQRGSSPRKPPEPSVQPRNVHQMSDQEPNRKNQDTILIKDIDPYKAKWVIKARVFWKSEIRHWKKETGEGSYFSVIFKDKSGEISAMGFNTSVDTFYEKLQEGKTYYLGNAKVQEKRPDPKTNRRDYELRFELTTELQECPDDEEIPKILKPDFKSLREISKLSPGTSCNTIAAIQAVSDVKEFTSKDSRQFVKREVTLLDQSDCQLRLTLWGSLAKDFQAPSSPVIVLRDVKVTEFNGLRNLTMTTYSRLETKSELAEFKSLAEWFRNQHQDPGNTSIIESSNGEPQDLNIYTIQDIKEMSFEDPTVGKNFITQGTVVSVDEKFSYPGCQNGECRRKVIKSMDGKWRCEKCNDDHEAPKHRYLLHFHLADHTGVAKFQAFDEAGNIIMGRTADELMALKNSNLSEWQAAMDIIKGKTYNVAFNAKEDHYEGRKSRKFTVNQMGELDYNSELSVLLSQLKSGEEA